MIYILALGSFGKKLCQLINALYISKKYNLRVGFVMKPSLYDDKEMFFEKVFILPKKITCIKQHFTKGNPISSTVGKIYINDTSDLPKNIPDETEVVINYKLAFEFNVKLEINPNVIHKNIRNYVKNDYAIISYNNKKLIEQLLNENLKIIVMSSNLSEPEDVYDNRVQFIEGCSVEILYLIMNANYVYTYETNTLYDIAKKMNTKLL